MPDKEVTVLIPNYKTLELTRFCLRSLRLHTDQGRVRVIVVDNDSADASLDYLRGVRWIELIERRDIVRETGPEMHARALDQAFSLVSSPLVMVMHTDTIVVDNHWLDFLTGFFAEDAMLGGVGSWKLETIPAWKMVGKQLEETCRRLFARKIREERRYLRSHCAVYRTEAVRNFTAGFFDGHTAGQSLHQRMLDAGYRMRFLESAELCRHVRHLNHATMILNPRPQDRKTARWSARRRIFRELAQLDYEDISADASLDR